MPIAERLGARSRCFVAPVGSDPNDRSVWTEIGSVDGDALTLEKAAHSYSWPTRHLVGTQPGTYEVQFSTMNLSQELLDLYYGKTSTSNERSKPMGLKETVHHEDANGRIITIGYQEDRDSGKGWIRTSSSGAYIEDAHIIPFALNALGHDRPELGQRQPFLSSDVQSYSPVVRSDEHRQELLTDAVLNLRAIDLYDQHVVKKKADEEAAAKAAELAAAKARVEVANREIAERHLRKAKVAYDDAVSGAFWADVTPEVTARLQSALSAYETARRKVEGLPN